jgi:hypothetical protein
MNKDNLAETITIIDAPEPQVPSLARVTSYCIRELIQEHLKSGPESLRDAARDLNVLPLSPADDERWYGVRPDGDLILFNPRSPYDPIEEEDFWKRAVTLSRAVEQYPTLEPLVPPPPLSCQTCPRCGGSGVITRAGGEIICICGGLGWMPSIEDEIEGKDPRTARRHDDGK